MPPAAEEVIGKIKAGSVRLLTDDNGDLTLMVKVDRESRYGARRLVEEAKKVEAVTVQVDKFCDRRSLRQNRMMWALLEILARNQNGGRTGGVTAWDCYLDMIEEYGCKYEYLECLKEALPALKKMFRAVKVVEERKGGRTVMCKAFVGSSEYTTTEMQNLIDGLLDRLAELGIDDGEVQYWRERHLSDVRPPRAD